MCLGWLVLWVVGCGDGPANVTTAAGTGASTTTSPAGGSAGAGTSGTGASTSSGGAGGTGTGGTGGATTGTSTASIAAVIKADPPAIPHGDNFKTQVTLDGSGSSSDKGALTYAWDIGAGKVESGDLKSAKLVATFEGIDNAPVSLTVSDGQGTASASAIIRLQSPPVVIVPDEYTTDAGMPVKLDASLSFDRDGDPLSFKWNVASGPAGGQVDSMPDGTANFVSSTPGDYKVTIDLLAGGQTVQGSTIVHVFPAMNTQEPLGVTVTAMPPVAAKGTSVAFQIKLAQMPAGPFTVTLRAGSQTIPVNNLSGNAVFNAPGDYPVVADVIAVGRAGRGRASLQVYDPAKPDNGPPFVSLSSPQDGARITSTVQAAGTVSDTDLAAYYLEARQTAAGNGEPWQVLSKGTNPVNGNVGPIEVTLLRQGDYVLRLRAVDQRGHESIAQENISVDYAHPRGDLRFVLTDFKAAFSGPPIAIRRGYDSLDKNVGDFGYGWTLSSSGNGSVTHANTIGQGWDASGTDCIFNFNLAELENHLITVSIGDNRQFYAPTPQIESCITGAVVVINSFTRLSGGKGTLTIEHQDEELLIPNGDNNMYRFDALFDPQQIYDPNDYTVMNADGSTAKFSNGGAGGNPKLVQMRDANGNGFDVTPDQKTITHTSGASISLERNADGRVTAIVRPDGKKRTYVYNAAQELIRASDFDGRTTRYYYGPDHLLSRIVGPRGNVVFDARYDDNSRLLEVQNGAADTSALTAYDTPNHKELTILPDGVQDFHAYDDNGNTTLRTLNGIQVEKYSADAQAKVNSFTDATGRTTTLQYDDTNGPTAINPEGTGNVSLQWDNNGFLTGMSTPKGQITYQRDATGHMTQMTGGGQNIQLQRDSTGKVSHLDLNGYAMDFTHDAKGYVTSVKAEGKTFNYDTNGVGDITGVHYTEGGHKHDITMTVDSDGVPTSTTAMVDGVMVSQQAAAQDAEGSIAKDGAGRQIILDGRGRPQHLIEGGAVTSREYDKTGRLTAVVLPEGGRTEFSTDPATGAQVTTLPNGDKQILTTDANGRPASLQTAGNQVTKYTYDAKGHLTVTDLPDGRQSKATYDANGRITQKTHPDGTVEQFTFDGNGNMLTRKIGSHPAFQYTYLNDQIASVTSPTGVKQARTYDAEGRLSGVVYQGGPAPTLYTYVSKQLATITDPAGHMRSFTRQKLGTEQVESRPSGATQTSTMTPDHKLQTVDYDGHTVVATLNDQNRITGVVADDGTATQTVYDRDGRLASFTDATGTTSFARDTLGRVLLVTLSDGRTLKIGYDKVFGASTITTQGGTDTIEYSPNGRVKRVDLDAMNGIDVGYDAGGRQSSYTLGNLSVNVTYGPEGLVTNTTTKWAGGLLLSDDVTYDDDGRPTAIASSAGMARSFAYDPAERLTKDTDVTYKYDAASNLTGIGADTLTFDVDDHPLTFGAATLKSDKSGHLLSMTGGAQDVKLAWDGLGRLVKATIGAQTVNYTYDANGLLVARDDGSDHRRFLWTGHEAVPSLIEEYDAKTGAVLAHNTHLGRVLVRKVGAHTYTFVHDSLSNARLVVDETGKVVDTREFTAYGSLRSGSTTLDMPFGFAGAWTDPVTGFVFMRARWYAPELGRFLSEDPEEPRLEVPITLNRFQYGNGMPTVFVDPLGKQDLVGLLSTMAGYGNLNAMSTLTSVNYYLSLTSQFAALALGFDSLDRSGLFKFIQQNNKSWIPTSVLIGLNGSAWGGGIGITLGVEALMHFATKNFNGTTTPYYYWGGPGAGSSAIQAAKDAGVDPSVLDIPPQGGGIVGTQAFIGAGYSFYVGLAWDVIHPGAYSGPFSAVSAPPALLLPFITLNALVQMDGAGQLAAVGAFAGAVAYGVNALSTLGPSFSALITATFNSAMAAANNPGQIWIKQPPPSTVALNNASNNFNNALKNWADAASISFAYSPFASESNLCQWDAQNSQWINCQKAQAWSLTFDRSAWFGSKLFGKSGANTINPVTSAPQLFSYSFTMYNCLFNGFPGTKCDEKVDINDNRGFW
jgi:RHS repeat-associated protein